MLAWLSENVFAHRRLILSGASLVLQTPYLVVGKVRHLLHRKCAVWHVVQASVPLLDGVQRVERSLAIWMHA